ncbi:hypothetical protein Scep_010890 [Stephania cephalantha]|uniref:Pentatricopeptide repeat-containing protein n=1 Tax=Stephania cephalantha TaxID=152367 RepID=A0AAP0JWQ8_9MAGN
MTLSSLSTSRSRVLLRSAPATVFASSCRDQSSQLGFRLSDAEVIRTRNSEAWIVKVVSTLCVVRASKAKSLTDLGFLECFDDSFNPYIVYGVVRRLGNPELGLKFFDFCCCRLRRREESNRFVKTLNFLVKSLCQCGFHESASKLVFDGHFPDGPVFDYLVCSCAKLGKIDIAKQLLVQSCCCRVKASAFAHNNVLNALVANGRVEEAVCFFKDRHLRLGFCPDTCSFNIVIRGLCRLGKIDLAFELFDGMGSFDCSPDVVTCNTLIDGFCRAKDVDRGYECLTQIQSRTGFSPDVVSYTSVISGYCRLGRMGEASAILDEMINKGIIPNSFTFNVLINGFGKMGNMPSALNIYERMLSRGCIPDVVTFTSLIDGHCKVGETEEGMKIWNEMGRKNISPNAYTFSVLTNALCKENRLNEARDLLQQLRWSNVVPQPFIYNPVIDGFCKAGNVDEANLILAEMEEKRCNPDKYTFTSLIIGHSMKGRMEEAIGLFDKMTTIGCTPDTITISSFVSCLFKAGMPSEASRIMVTFSERDLDPGLSSLRRSFSSTKNVDIRVAA